MSLISGLSFTRNLPETTFEGMYSSMANNRLDVVMVSKRNSESEEIYTELAANPKYSIKMIETAEGAMSYIVQGNLDCIIFNFENFGNPQAKIIVAIRNIAKVFQIIIFADKTEPEAVALVKNMKSLTVIEKPLMNVTKDITGLCQRLIGEDEKTEIFKRESKRLATNQSAKIDILSTNQSIEGTVIDLSQKGCCIQSAAMGLKAGDLLRVTIDLDKLGRKRIVVGEIRWVSGQPGRRMAGLKFVKIES